MTEADTPVHLAHFSDLHVTARRLGWNRRDFISKRVTGWLNLRLLGRGYRFRQAAAVAVTLTNDLKRRPFDAYIFSGDATALGFESEMREAAQCLGVADEGNPPAVAVPGNHDYYTRSAWKHGWFEKYFQPWQVGERVDEHAYPFARKIGLLWLIGVSSSTFNFWHWDASGEVGLEQRDRLQRLLKQLPPGPRLMVTHYPVSRSDGRPERSLRCLRDWKEVVRVAADGGVSLWLHGHRHKPYHHSASAEIPFPLLCAGSATQSNL